MEQIYTTEDWALYMVVFEGHFAFIISFIALITDRRNSFHYSLLQWSNFLLPHNKVQMFTISLAKQLLFKRQLLDWICEYEENLKRRSFYVREAMPLA